MLLVGAVSPQAALTAVGDGVQVYAFLAGIMVLAEIARRDGLFAWIVEAALRIVEAALRIVDGSRARLFTTLYGVGVVVTALLSNDITAIVLTPAILTALARTDADPLPYLYACAFVAGAASFVLPISNPANLVVFDGHLPPLAAWIAAFGLSALLAVVLTYFALRVLLRKKILGNYALKGASAQLDRSGKVALTAVGSAALLLVIANARGGAIGTVSLAAGACALIVVSLVDRPNPAVRRAPRLLGDDSPRCRSLRGRGRVERCGGTESSGSLLLVCRRLTNARRKPGNRHRSDLGMQSRQQSSRCALRGKPSAAFRLPRRWPT